MAKTAYIGVNNIARQANNIYVGVNGIARKASKIYIGDTNGKARLCWDQSELLAGNIAVGTIVKLMEGGKAVEYLVVNQGIPGNSSLYDASCDGTWLLRKDCHSNRQWHTSNVNDYANSAINAWLNNDFFNSFRTTEQAVIKQVKIPYRAGSGESTTATVGKNGLGVKVFLLSSIELNIKFGTEPVNEGVCLSYFNGTPTNSDDEKRIRYLNGSAINWWTRSPFATSGWAALRTRAVNTAGNGFSNYCSNSIGVCPALVLPSNAKFDPTTMLLKAA